jgi:hypothetical protein
MCECGRCGEIFTSLSAFDAHQDVVYGRIPPVICWCWPTRRRLVRRPDGRWSLRVPERDRKRLARFRAGTPARS